MRSRDIGDSRPGPIRLFRYQTVSERLQHPLGGFWDSILKGGMDFEAGIPIAALVDVTPPERARWADARTTASQRPANGFQFNTFYMHTLFYHASHILRVCLEQVYRRHFAIFPTACAHFVNLCHILVILTIFQTSSLYYYYYDYDYYYYYYYYCCYCYHSSSFVFVCYYYCYCYTPHLRLFFVCLFSFCINVLFPPVFPCNLSLILCCACP
jgi:hypothetical protein